MKVLLIGEYSGLHGDLASGLTQNGVEVTFIAYGDAFKRFPVDINVDSTAPGIMGKIIRRFRALKSTFGKRDFDIVQIINPWVFGRLFPYKILYRQLKRNNGKLFFLAAGIDAYYWKYANTAMRYSPIQDMKTLDFGNNNSYMNSDLAMRFNNWCLAISNGVIPVAYDFEVCYNAHPKLLKTLPMPIDVDKIDYVGVSEDTTYNLFHGLNRAGFKGTRHVEKAFDCIDQVYGGLVHTSIQGRMSFDKYIEVMRSADIVVDQTSSYGLGMNALYAMALGKVVLGGNEPETNRIYSIPNPAINILPNDADIVDKIEALISDKELLRVLGRKSRHFVEVEHDYRIVAKKFVKLWGEAG